jgi:hypothetical protein
MRGNSIKNYFLITQGLIIEEVIEFHEYLLLPPYGAIYKEKPYQDQYILTDLILSYNKTKDIRPLQNLNNLTHLDLENNKITSSN